MIQGGMKNLRSGSSLVVLAVSMCLGWGGCARLKGGGSSAEPKTEDEKIIYTWGALLGRNATALALTPAEVELVKAGLTDSVEKKKLLTDMDKYGPQIQQLAQKRAGVRAEAEKGKSAALLDAAAKEPGAIKLPSGVIIKMTRPGTGAQPAMTDQVKVHYAGHLGDGTEFDSSYKRGEPAVFPLNGVIKCWGEGVGSMKVGGKATLTCPSEMAYGERGQPPSIPGNAVLFFDVELLEIVNPTPMSAPPPVGGAAAVAAPPKH
jgi:FKBP-type peptidyl-prolyl cis-trans isomerase FkpA